MVIGLIFCIVGAVIGQWQICVLGAFFIIVGIYMRKD